MKKVLLLALLALTACGASVPIRWASPSDFALTVVDHPTLKRFDLTLTSHSSALLCLSIEAWPAKEGLPLGFLGSASVATHSGIKTLLPTGSAYCPGGCGEVRLKPGHSVRGVLPYAVFHDALVIASDSHRELDYQVHPYVCSN